MLNLKDDTDWVKRCMSWDVKDTEELWELDTEDAQ